MDGWDVIPADTMTCVPRQVWPSVPSASKAETTLADLAHARAQLASLHLGDLIRQRSPLPRVLHALCQRFEVAFGYHTCLVLLLDQSGLKVETVVATAAALELRSRLLGRASSNLEGIHLPGWQLLQTSPVQRLTGEVTAILVALVREDCRAEGRAVQPSIEIFCQAAGSVIERVRHDEALRRSEALLHKVQSHSSSYSFSWCSKADVVDCSTELRQLYGIDSTENLLTLSQIHTRIYREDLPSFREVIEQARHGVAGFEHEHRLLMPDDSVKYVHLVAHQSGAQGSCHDYIGVVQDVTHQRTTQEVLATLQAEIAGAERLASLGVMSAAIAHEVNQPLSGIVTNAYTCLLMLSADSPNLQGALETARRTIRDAERACAVIKKIRTMFAGNIADREQLDVNEVVGELISLMEGDLMRNKVTLRVELNLDLPAIHGDRVQLQQVVLNLISNASDAMREISGPRVLTVRTSHDGGRSVRVSIQDTGHGIEQGKVNRLFDAFYTTKTEGMGMGLCISRSIIELHGGKLSVESNSGSGATFAFTIPAGCG